MFHGLSAFPLTPSRDGRVDHDALARLVSAAVAAGVDSIGALGSTGGYAYLDGEKRRAAARTAVSAAVDTPVVVGVGAISTRDVLRNVEAAVEVGAAGVLLAPVSYQPLTDAEVFSLYDDVTSRFDLPVIVYDNPATTGFTFSRELLADIAHLPHIASIKLDSLATDAGEAREGVMQLRDSVPAGVTMGISGDADGARGLLAGCDVWYSVLGGVFPRACVDIAASALAGDSDQALALSAGLDPIWALFARYGSFRAIAAIATITGLLPGDAVHAPVRPLAGADREVVAEVLGRVGPRS